MKRKIRRKMMEYVIGGVLAIIVIITIGLLLRKKLYDAVDHYEDWKLDIMNRNVPSELSRVKKLNLAGDTKEKFEGWKQAWDDILTVDLATIEELLYDTEKAADRYNFPTAKNSMRKMEAILVEVEEKIKDILKQLNELMDTEKNNREEVETLGPKLKELRKRLAQNRFQYSRAEVRFEIEMDEIQHVVTSYQQLMEEGNYTQGTEMIQAATTKLEALEVALDEFPGLYQTCKHTLPLQLDELYKGLQEMKQEGYQVEDLHMIKEVNEYQSRLHDMVDELENGEAEAVKPMIPEMEERIKEMYDQLEKEALARNYVETKIPTYERALKLFETDFTGTKTEVERLKQAYFFEDADLEQYMALDKRFSQLKDQLTKFINKVRENEQAHSKLRAELEGAFTQLETIEEEHDTFKTSIQNLRKDELEAREQLKRMNDDIYKTSRVLRSSNLPGVPNFIWSLLEDASNKNERVLLALDQQPLDIMDVQQSLREAHEAVSRAMEKTNVMLEQAYLTEHVIQYANRYRSSNPPLAAKLVESEDLFRKAEYELALEGAAKALEDIEPGALKKVEKFQELTVSI